MSGPDLEVQGAVVAKLKADTDLQALIGNPIRLFQDPPPRPVGAVTFEPYITIGEGQNVPDVVQCIEGSEIFLDVHIWSSGPGFAECKEIAAVIEAIIHDANLTLGENRCVCIERDGARYLRDPDNVTKHAVVTFRALTEPTS